MILKREEKEKLVIQLAEVGKTTRHIAQVVHISPKDIGTIIRNYLGEDNLECLGKGLSVNSRAFKLFKEDKNKDDVAIALDIDADQVFYIYEDYLRLLSLDRLTTMYKEMGMTVLTCLTTFTTN